MDGETTADALNPVHNCTPRYFGPHAGIRCLHCNTPVDPDPRVSATAEFPSPNTDATLAAVAGRGERCARCGHWTFTDLLTGVGPGRPTLAGLCRNCLGLGNGEPTLIRITGRSAVSARFLR